jgi:hypothetical protein
VVIEVPEDLFDDLRHRLQTGFGFRVAPRHFAVVGRCSACAPPAAR